MLSFDEARQVVEAQHGPTFDKGSEDDTGYVIVPVNYDTDLVTVVDKATGQLDRLPYGQVASRVASMTPAPAPEPEPTDPVEEAGASEES